MGYLASSIILNNKNEKKKKLNETIKTIKRKIKNKTLEK